MTDNGRSGRQLAVDIGWYGLYGVMAFALSGMLLGALTPRQSVVIYAIIATLLIGVGVGKMYVGATKNNRR